MEGEARAVEADKHERRIQRQGGDRAGGGADRLAVRSYRGHDRDAGGEMADRVPELGGGDLGSGLIKGCHRQAGPSAAAGRPRCRSTVMMPAPAR